MLHASSFIFVVGKGRRFRVRDAISLRKASQLGVTRASEHKLVKCYEHEAPATPVLGLLSQDS